MQQGIFGYLCIILNIDFRKTFEKKKNLRQSTYIKESILQNQIFCFLIVQTRYNDGKKYMRVSPRVVSRYYYLLLPFAYFIKIFAFDILDILNYTEKINVR